MTLHVRRSFSFITPSLWAAAALLSTGLAWAAQAPAPAAKSGAQPADEVALAHFKKTIAPILEEHCYECHGDGAKKGGLAFDELTSKEQIVHNPELWWKVLRNTRSHIMPPPGETAPTPAEQVALEQWIKTGAFGLDLNREDPGRVTVRRLNRTEYRNTMRDLMGIDFDAEHALAADDIGYGFDNIGDVLSLSPMRMEKFLEAAQNVVKKSVPAEPTAMTEQMIAGKDFAFTDGSPRNEDRMSFYKDATLQATLSISIPGEYRIVTATSVDGTGNPDPQKCRGTILCDGKEFYSQEYVWADCMYYQNEHVLRLEPGEHKIEFHLTPLDPTLKPRGKMDLKLVWVQAVGPLDRKDWAPAPNYARFFPRPKAPEGAVERRAYAREVLTQFATKAYRQPPAAPLVDRLVALAEGVYSVPGTSFEVGISRAIVAILASPRFIFRFEDVEPAASGASVANIDEYALASRLSYFLWSSQPDDTLLKLASSGSLRKNLSAEVQRMLADPKSSAFTENFAGQWLLSREVSHIALNRQIVLAREGIKPPAPRRGGFGAAAPTDLTIPERDALKKEAEVYFNYVVRENRNVLELIDSDYAFVNETLATYYGMPADTAKGDQMRKITLATDDPRGGGVLTMGSTLAVTSNPTRTSPVKRGKWILENILGAPAPPPPPAVPSLEETEKRISDRVPTQRELLAIHREDALCASCHNRMDPLGLALENFNALGLYRTQELGQPVDSTGELFTGEKFKNIRDLKNILRTKHQREFYLTLTEKLMTYALGRGVEYYDVPTLDKIVDRLERHEGHFGELLMGVIESAPFQQRRIGAPPTGLANKVTSLTTTNPLSQ